MMMASMVANGNRDGRQGEALVLKGVDPETCMIVFKNHWAQVNKTTTLSCDPRYTFSSKPSFNLYSSIS